MKYPLLSAINCLVNGDHIGYTLRLLRARELANREIEMAGSTQDIIVMELDIRGCQPRPKQPNCSSGTVKAVSNAK